MDERGRIVAAGYDAVANEYAALEQPGKAWPRLRLLRNVLTRIPPGVTVLDLGCGNGVPALVEIARSHEAVGVDLSGTQADLARANVPTAEVFRAEPMFFSHYDAETTLRLVEEAGFEVLDAHRATQLEGEIEVEFLWVTAKRN